MKRIIPGIIALLLFITTVQGQDVIWKLTYDVSFPFAATREFTEPVSWRGLSLDMDRFLTSSVSVGFGFSWSTFVEKEPDSYYQYDDMLIHGTQVRYVNNIPILARFSGYIPAGPVDAYATLGAGPAWQEQRREVGTFAFVGSYWQFALAPEVGVIVPVGPSFLTAKVKYLYAFSTSEAPELTHLAIGLGIAW